MLIELVKIAGVAAAFLALFALAELIHRKTDTETEITRKMVHVLGGIISVLFPFIFTKVWPVAVLAVLFVGIIWLSKKKGYLPSIHNIGRHTQGSYLYPMAILLCFWVYILNGNILFFFIPVIVLAISDPSAAFFGKLFPYGKYTFLGETKTIVGSLAFFFSAAVIVIICLHYERLLIVDNWRLIGCVSLFGTLAEGLGRRGEDNIWIPIAVIAAMRLINF